MNVIFLIAAALAASDVELRTADGQAVVGSLVRLSAAEAAIETPAGLRAFSTDSLAAIVRPGLRPRPPGALELRVELADGSSIVAADFMTHGDSASLTVAGRKLTVPRKAVASMRLAGLNPAMTAEWNRILENKPTGDLLVIRKGDAIDYHQGVLGDVSETEVTFTLDGDRIPVKRIKVCGVVYYHGPSQSPAGGVCKVFDADGSTWAVQSLKLADELQLQTPAGLSISLPLSKLCRIEFAAKEDAFLSDVKPESVQWRPYVAPSKDLPVLAEFNLPQWNKASERTSLSLAGRRYAKAIAATPRTTIVFRLPERFRSLKAVAGIDDQYRPNGAVKLTISGDDRVLFEGVFLGSGPPRAVECDLTGVRRLTLSIEFAKGFESGSRLLICDPRLLK